MNIIIPMAGLGERFSKAGFIHPKPLIPVIDKPMYRYVVDCLPLSFATHLVFILRKSNDSVQLENDIHEHYSYLPRYTIITLENETRGQAETVLMAANILDMEQPTLVHNCDTYVTDEFQWEDIINQEVDGAISLFLSQEKRWSYARVDESSLLRVLRLIHVASNTL